MTNQLNGWQRIGIVLTALWLVVVALLGAVSVFETGPFGEKAKATYETTRTDAVCSKPASHHLAAGQKTITLSWDEVYGCATGAMISGPSERTVQVSPRRDDFFLAAFLAALLIPPALFWLLSYVFALVFKWVAQGFRGAT